MKRKRNIVSILLAVSLMLLIPASTAFAQGTTVEVNSGDTVVLEPDESIAASATDGITVEVKDLPDFGAPENGLAGFTFTLDWDPGVIRVDSVIPSVETAANWNILSSTPDNISGTVTVAGFTTVYSTDDIILLYLGITATGDNGDTTSISVTVTELIDKENMNIPAMPVNAPVVIESEQTFSVNWLPPLTTQEVYTMQNGSTVPVKFQILDEEGYPVTGEEVMVTVTRNSDATVVFSGPAVYQPDSEAYKVNVKTKGWENGEYTITTSASEEDCYSLNVVDKAKGKAKQKGK